MRKISIDGSRPPARATSATPSSERWGNLTPSRKSIYFGFVLGYAWKKVFPRNIRLRVNHHPGPGYLRLRDGTTTEERKAAVCEKFGISDGKFTEEYTAWSSKLTDEDWKLFAKFDYGPNGPQVEETFSPLKIIMIWLAVAVVLLSVLGSMCGGGMSGGRGH